ncbi:hypothetical protein RA2_02220 [Roseovarius sp. A-2]|nr:hypothetical protein RA2_02220 [Roseovarius sp. A-2]
MRVNWHVFPGGSGHIRDMSARPDIDPSVIPEGHHDAVAALMRETVSLKDINKRNKSETARQCRSKIAKHLSIEVRAGLEVGP